MKIQLLLTGNELMSGHTLDSNSSMIAQYLSEHAYTVYRKVTVGDDPELLAKEMEQQSLDSDVLIVNGGLGPTIDDLTAEILSKVTGMPLVVNPDAMTHLQGWCEQRKLILNEANKKQAVLPQGVTIIPNPTGSAVGFSLTHNNCLIICTPGVPSELKGMLEQTIVQTICSQFPNDQVNNTIRIQTFGLGESTLQEMVLKDYPNWPQEVEFSFRAGIPQLEIKLSISAYEHSNMQKECYEHLQTIIGDYIIGEQDVTLAEKVFQLLSAQKSRITTAESCTGGMIASAITQVPGASQVFEAGYITYSNSIKHQLLRVPNSSLESHGAVSEQVVIAMAEGAIEKSQADYAIAVSGVAGPDGGSEEKPVGTVWMAWGQKGALKTKRLQYNGNRKWLQQMVTATTLDLIRRELLGIESEPHYFQRLK